VLKSKFKIKFQVFSKIEVNGENCHPVYSYLRRNSELYDAKSGNCRQIPWNFAKFLLDGDGKVLRFISSEVPPNEFKEDIIKLLDG
jgi:glutathione peroxidase